jgi:hypothetical protein
MKLLSRREILDAFNALAKELPPGSPTEIIIGGGAALVLLYGAREATKDVDALRIAPLDSSSVRAAARRVASRVGLPEDWLNDGAKGYLHGLMPGEILFDSPSLVVRSAAPRQLLAMKLSAWRDDVDIGDARLLLSKLEGSRDGVWVLIETLSRARSGAQSPLRFRRSLGDGTWTCVIWWNPCSPSTLWRRDSGSLTPHGPATTGHEFRNPRTSIWRLLRSLRA